MTASQLRSIFEEPSRHKMVEGGVAPPPPTSRRGGRLSCAPTCDSGEAAGPPGLVDGSPALR